MQNAILSAMELNAQIKTFHALAVKNGFYNNYETVEKCSNPEVRYRLADLLHGEVAEAYEAYRTGKIDVSQECMNDAIHTSKFKDLELFTTIYKERIKGTVAEELADTYIRICDKAGAYEIEFNDAAIEDIGLEVANIGEKKCIHDLFFHAERMVGVWVAYRNCNSSDVAFWLAYVYALADYFKIDLHKHVELKHLYNTTRSYKHGKDF
jgi:hypothetical protein